MANVDDWITRAKQQQQEADENRRLSNTRGDDISNYLQSREGYYGNNEEDYRSRADRAFQDISDRPGYSAADEAAIKGDPNAAFKYYDPNKLTSQTDQNAADLAEKTGAYQGGLTGSSEDITQHLREAAGKYGQGVTEAAGASRDRMNATLDNQLNWQGGVYNYQRGENEGAYGDLDKGLTGAIDPGKLGLSDEFKNDYRMSDAEKQNIRDVAGQGVRGQYQKMSDEAQQRAMAGGNTSPAALAAIQERLGREGAAAAGDAMSRAELQANTEAANRLQTTEGMRLGSEQDISNRETGAA